MRNRILVFATTVGNSIAPVMGTRTSRINALRGFLREFGIAIPVAARSGIEAISRVLWLIPTLRCPS